MAYLGDFALSTNLYTKFTTVNASGVPTTLAAPTFGFYQDANVTLFTSGVTVTADFNSTTGLNHLQMIVTTSATGIVAGSAYQLVIATGSVSGVSMKGYVLGEFTVLRTTALRPTTAGNTLDVNSNGEAGLDWGNIGNQGTTNSFTATTLFTATNVTNGVTVTAISTLVNANVTAITTNVGAIVTGFNTIAPANVTSISTVVNANITAFTTILPARITAQGIDVGAIVTAFNTIAPANVTAYSTVLSVNITASSTVLVAAVTVVNASGQKQIENAVWDAIATDHNTALTLGNKLNSAASAGDPWTTAIPGAYGAGTAGNILGNNLNATVTSRAAVTMLPTNFAVTDISVLGIVGADTKLMATVTVKGSGTSASLWRG